MSPDRPFAVSIDSLGDARPLALVIEFGRRIILKKDLGEDGIGVLPEVEEFPEI